MLFNPYSFLFRNNKQPYQDEAEQININTNVNNSDSESDGENDSSNSSSDDESSENYQEKGPSFASSNDIKVITDFMIKAVMRKCIHGCTIIRVKVVICVKYVKSMCKVCEVYDGNSPHSSGSNKGA